MILLLYILLLDLQIKHSKTLRYYMFTTINMRLFNCLVKKSENLKKTPIYLFHFRQEFKNLSILYIFFEKQMIIAIMPLCTCQQEVREDVISGKVHIFRSVVLPRKEPLCIGGNGVGQQGGSMVFHLGGWNYPIFKM